MIETIAAIVATLFGVFLLAHIGVMDEESEKIRVREGRKQ